MTAQVIIIGVVILFFIIFFSMVPVGLWVSAIASGVRIGIFDLIGMKLRRVKLSKIVFALIKSTKAGLNLKANQLEAHYLAGGNIGVMDYYKMQNVLADTDMKASIGEDAHCKV